MGAGTLRRYHRVRASGTVPTLPAGSTPTQPEATAAADANALKLGNEQQEQVVRVQSGDFPPVPPQSVHGIIERKAGANLDGSVPEAAAGAPARGATTEVWRTYISTLEPADRPEGYETMGRDQMAQAILDA